MTDYYVNHEQACRLARGARENLGKMVDVEVESSPGKSIMYRMFCAGMIGDHCIFIDRVERKGAGRFSIIGREGLEEYADYYEGTFKIPATLSQQKVHSLDDYREEFRQRMMEVWNSYKLKGGEEK